MFFGAGFDTVQTSLTWTAMELVKNPDVQEALIKDVVDAVIKHGPIDYTTVQQMPYLDCVVKGNNTEFECNL